MQIRDITNIMGFTSAVPEVEAAKSEFDPEKLGEKQSFYSWETAGRVEKKELNHKFARNLMVIGVVVSLLLAIMGEFFLILVIASVIFVSHVLSQTPPELIKYELSNYGLEIDEQLFTWDKLSRYFFVTNVANSIIAVDTKEKFPGRLFVAFKEEDRDRVKEIFSRYLPFVKEEPLGFMDKTYQSFVDKFNFEK